MEFPTDLKYADTDEWVRVEDEVATLGVTDYAQDQLSDVVYFEATVGVGEDIGRGDAIAIVESVKAASDIYAPVSGEVTGINETLPDNPELINSDPFREAWMLRIRMVKPSELDELMDSVAYQKNTEERSG